MIDVRPLCGASRNHLTNVVIATAVALLAMIVSPGRGRRMRARTGPSRRNPHRSPGPYGPLTPRHPANLRQGRHVSQVERLRSRSCRGEGTTPKSLAEPSRPSPPPSPAAHTRAQHGPPAHRWNDSLSQPSLPDTPHRIHAAWRIASEWLANENRPGMRPPMFGELSARAKEAGG
jgi:hypothetical protein